MCAAGFSTNAKSQRAEGANRPRGSCSRPGCALRCATPWQSQHAPTPAKAHRVLLAREGVHDVDGVVVCKHLRRMRGHKEQVACGQGKAGR